MAKRYQVIIAGGGPVGVALAVNLGLRGISCIVVERHLQPQRIPKGQNLLQRTMEHFWFWGLAEELRNARVMPREFPMSGIVSYGDLGSDYWYAPPLRELLNPYYFLENERMPQYQMESVLRKKAAELPGVELRLGWSVETVEQDDAGVRVEVVRTADGASEVLEGCYAVGCDGSNSRVREEIGISSSGAEYNQLMVLTVFRSRELSDHLKQRFPLRSTYRVVRPDLKGYWQFFGRVDADEAWFFHAPVPPDTTRDNFDFQGMIEKIAGFPCACEFDYVGFWDLRVAVADSYQAGRVFIAGDAAHSHPPYGGYGVNNGLEDVVNLGWKLAARLQGWGADALLQSYGEERHATFRETADDFIAARIESDRMFFDQHSPANGEEEFEQAWKAHAKTSAPRILNYEPHYEGSSIVAGPPGAKCSAHGSHTFNARTGHHLPPHLLSSGRNVYEELGRNFTLLAFGVEDAATLAFEQAATQLGIPLKVVRDSAESDCREYESKLILVRPDQYVAWCGDKPPAAVGQLMGKTAGY